MKVGRPGGAAHPHPEHECAGAGGSGGAGATGRGSCCRCVEARSCRLAAVLHRIPSSGHPPAAGRGRGPGGHQPRHARLRGRRPGGALHRGRAAGARPAGARPAGAALTDTKAALRAGGAGLLLGVHAPAPARSPPPFRPAQLSPPALRSTPPPAVHPREDGRDRPGGRVDRRRGAQLHGGARGCSPARLQPCLGMVDPLEACLGLAVGVGLSCPTPWRCVPRQGQRGPAASGGRL